MEVPELAVCQQTGVGRDPASVKFQLQATVETDPQMRLSGFTRRVTRLHPSDDGIALILIEESTRHVIKLTIHPGNPGKRGGRSDPISGFFRSLRTAVLSARLRRW